MAYFAVYIYIYIYIIIPVEKPVLMRKKMETQDRAMVKGFPTRLSIIILYVDHRSRRKQQQAREKEKCWRFLHIDHTALATCHTIYKEKG